jgi:GNAT superfamily N-acetyltransferase
VPEADALFDPPVLLTQSHDSSKFESGEPVLDDWLRKRAWQNLQNAASRTYVVCLTGSKTISGYYALSMGQILAQETTGSMRRNMPTFIPAVMFGRLAIDRSCQGQGLGRALLVDVMQRVTRAANEVAARLIVVHAISSAAEAYYLQHGFTRLPVGTPTLALDLVKLKKFGNPDSV